jgi:hypothetical protein
MLGRKTYTQEELDHARDAVVRQLAAYRRLTAALDAATDDPEVAAALAELETVLFDTTTLALDRHFVHRIRAVSGKDGNPLNEVELMAESLMNDGGVMQGSNVIKLKPDETVLKLSPGDEIRLSDSDFERLSAAFLAEIEGRFVVPDAA